MSGTQCSAAWSCNSSFQRWRQEDQKLQVHPRQCRGCKASLGSWDSVSNKNNQEKFKSKLLLLTSHTVLFQSVFCERSDCDYGGVPVSSAQVSGRRGLECDCCLTWLTLKLNLEILVMSTLTNHVFPFLSYIPNCGELSSYLIKLPSSFLVPLFSS